MKARRTYESWANRVRDILCESDSMYKGSILGTSNDDWHHVRLEYQVYVNHGNSWDQVQLLSTQKNGMLGVYVSNRVQIFLQEHERHALRAFKRKEVRL